MSIVKNYLDQPAYERLTIDTYEEFVNLKLTRKPFRGEDVFTSVDYNELSSVAKTEINKLPIVVIDEKFHPDGFFSDVLDGKQQFYILISDDMEETYFVDTQGYKYARYVSFIENLPETFFIDKVV